MVTHGGESPQRSRPRRPVSPTPAQAKPQTNMNQILVLVVVVMILGFFVSCREGYRKQNGQWSWVTHDESAGKRVKWIEGIDNASFKVLSHKNFGVDRYAVYYKGKKIKHADPATFTILTKNDHGYAKDQNHVFLDNEVIIQADPNTFTLLDFPFSRDQNKVFNGTLPLDLNNVDAAAFRVTNEDALMAGMKSTILLSHFLEFNPDYAWIKSLSLDIENVIVGEWGTGETRSGKWKGLRRMEAGN